MKRGRKTGTTIRELHLDKIKQLKDAGATFADIANVLPYHLNTIKRAYLERYGAGERQYLGASLSTTMTQQQREWVLSHGGAGYMRGLIDAEMNKIEVKA